MLANSTFLDLRGADCNGKTLSCIPYASSAQQQDKYIFPYLLQILCESPIML